MFVGKAPRPKRVYKERGIPAYPAVGRQPDTLYGMSAWYGTIVDGEDLTVQQRREIEDLRLTDAEIITVRRLASSREYYWPTPVGRRNDRRPYFQFQCPIARRRKDGRIFVVAPGGEVKLVHADGWVF
ncbi:hypothetical protein [Sphingomonas sp. T9W2]|uniref:hypothetical protein n=1 Tax=Sphingomonas sp. T9W2 TaxID=3143183 RepID=UPI0031F4C2FA